jgi:hypothetical protein
MTNVQDVLPIKQPGMTMDAVDFSKKILHGSWHPRENTVAVSCLLFILPFSFLIPLFQIAATNNLFIWSGPDVKGANSPPAV